MNRKFRLIAAAAAVLLLTTLAVAGTSTDVFVAAGTTLGGTTLDQDFYELLYKKNGSKDTFIVSLRHGGKIVATATGTRELREERQTGGIGYREGVNGAREIAEIRLAGTKSVIIIDG